MQLDRLLSDLNQRAAQAVKHYWGTRRRQSSAQLRRGAGDQGNRSAVTGGAQMDGFLEMIAYYLQTIGFRAEEIHFRSRLELPGYFRPTKKWDLLVVRKKLLIAAIETKSQVGSFGNNFNNRTEEAMGSAVDLWTAYREGGLGQSTPWLGYLFLLQDCPASQRPVRADEPHFSVFPEFQGASYTRRYELFCRKLVRERHYQAAAFLMSPERAVRGTIGYHEPADDLTLRIFLRSLLSHAGSRL